MKELENLKAFLDIEYKGAFEYLFKFIVPCDQEEKIKRLLTGIDFQIRLSKNSKYLSISFKKQMQNSDEVIDIYQRLSVIPGIISL